MGTARARACDTVRPARHRRQRAQHPRRRGGAPGAAAAVSRSSSGRSHWRSGCRGGGPRRPDTTCSSRMAGCRGRSLDLMERYVEPGSPIARSATSSLGRILLATRSWVALERGDWDRAAETVELVLMEDCTLVVPQARIVLALLRARRGDPDPWTPLAEAREVAERTGQLWWNTRSRPPRPRRSGWKGVPRRSRTRPPRRSSRRAARRAVAGGRARLVAPPGRHRGADPGRRGRPVRTAAPRRLERRRGGMADRGLPVRGGDGAGGGR